MAYNKASLANLRPSRPGMTNNPNGRPPAFRTMMKRLPRNLQNKVMDVLWTAISMPNARQAAAYLKEKEDELPECGFMFEILVKGLMGKNGSMVLMDILDRLIGKPKQIQELTGSLNLTDKPRIEFGDEASEIEDRPETEEED